MRYDNRIVLFLDILGFRSIIENTVKKGIDKQQTILTLHNNLEDIGVFVRSKLKGEKLSTAVTQFSDSIIVSFLEEDKKLILRLIKTIQELIIDLVNKNILCRGAISYGKLIHTNRVVFGPALNDAYETETKAALYPRIILDRTIIDIGSQHKDVQMTLFGDYDYAKTKILSLLKKDTDEKYYIDYFPNNMLEPHNRLGLDVLQYIKSLRSIIINGLKANKPDLKVKYGWMKNKYNSLIHSLKQELEYRDEIDKSLKDYISNIKPLK